MDTESDSSRAPWRHYVISILISLTASILQLLIERATA